MITLCDESMTDHIETLRAELGRWWLVKLTGAGLLGLAFIVALCIDFWLLAGAPL